MQVGLTDPFVVPVAFGKQYKLNGKLCWPGLQIANDGKGIAYDLQVLPFQIGQWSVSFEEVLRLEANEKVSIFINVWHGNVGNSDLRGHIVDLQLVNATLGHSVPFKIVYRDSNQNWFASICEFTLNVMKPEGLDVRCEKRERYTPS
jgi:hypothetical protein